MTSGIDRVLMELWANWIPAPEEQALWSESLGRFSLRTATEALRIHKTRSVYPTPNLAEVLNLAKELFRQDAEMRIPISKSAEHAALAERCRQDADGHRMLVDSLTKDEIAATVALMNAKLRKVIGEMCHGPASKWSRVECGLFAAQYDIDLRNRTIEAGAGVAQ